MSTPTSRSKPKSAPTSHLEQSLREQGFARVAGVDEAGRGPLAGPVVAGAAVLGPGWHVEGVDDSKRLSAKRREELVQRIKESAQAWAVGLVEPSEIDRINIHHASLLAMSRAVEKLDPKADYLLVDGRFTLAMSIGQQAVVAGDRTCLCIAAASILAKVHRDHLMIRAHHDYPEYNFAANKGYPTKEHREALRRVGPCPIHRRSYGPVAQQCLEWGVD